MLEYPVELPAGTGRIVGEIHIDYVRVNYQKTAFEYDTPDWKRVVRTLRGDGPVLVQTARKLGYPANTSPLARLRTGYRRNVPGLNYLIPGDGSRPIHEMVKEWRSCSAGAYPSTGATRSGTRRPRATTSLPRPQPTPPPATGTTPTTSWRPRASRPRSASEPPPADRGLRDTGAVRLLLLADTHLPTRARDLPAQVWAEVEAADVVVHAGDWVTAALLDRLEQRSRRLLACWGNNDGPELRARLPEVARATLEGVRIAVVHETGQRAGREVRADRAHPDTDLLVFGHSHIPWDSTSPGGLRLLNPGSPTDRRRQPTCTYLTVQLEDGAVRSVQLRPTARDA